jgi:hypothetical protein
MIEVPLAELLSRLPASFRTDRDPGKGMVGLPCAELFSGNTPRLPAGRLRDFAPDHVLIPDGEDPDHPVTLEAGWLALLYKPMTVREELAADPAKNPPEGESLPLPSQESTAEPLSVVSPEPKVLPPVEVAPRQPHPQEEVASPADAMETAAATVLPHARRRLFDSLPIFLRHRPERPVIPASGHAPSQEFFPELVPAPLPPAAASAPSTLLASLSAEALASQAALQAIFMSEETFTVQAVVSRAACLPGLRACALARGDLVLATSDSPAGSELRTLSGQAMTLLTSIRSSSVGMGLGSVPAVTLHADGGALSILQEGELCLLVLHSGRGFLPGVRERLQEVLHHLPGTLSLTQGAVRG